MKKILIRRIYVLLLIAAGAVAAVITVLLVLAKDPAISDDPQNIADTGINNFTAYDSDLDVTADDATLPGKIPPKEQIESNEQIIYIAPEILYTDDNVAISVTSHVESQIYGQGIRFEYKNRSTGEIEVEVKPANDRKTSDENKTLVEPGTVKAHVLYIGEDAGPFTEGTYIFTVNAGDNSYTTQAITIKAYSD